MSDRAATRDAATLIVVDRRADEPRVLMGKRHAGHRFMPSKFVFPGGAVEPSDRRVRPATPLNPIVEAKLAAKPRRASPSLPRALALAALRETFEETGLVIGEKTEAPRAVEGAWGKFFALGFAPSLAGIEFLARAITPPGRWKRFDARFFVVDAACIQTQVDGIIHPEAELTELTWTPLSQAGSLDLPQITRMVLMDLRKLLDGDGDVSRQRPFYRQWRGKFRRELL